MTNRRTKILGQGLPGPRGFDIGDLAVGSIPVWDGSRWQVGATLEQLAGRYEYTSGTETVLDMSGNSFLAYLLYSERKQYGDADYRHGTLALAARANPKTGVGNEGHVVVTEIADLSGGTFAASGYTVTYASGGGVPNTTIWYWRLSL